MCVWLLYLSALINDDVFPSLRLETCVIRSVIDLKREREREREREKKAFSGALGDKDG